MGDKRRSTDPRYKNTKKKTSGKKSTRSTKKKRRRIRPFALFLRLILFLILLGAIAFGYKVISERTAGDKTVSAETAGESAEAQEAGTELAAVPTEALTETEAAEEEETEEETKSSKGSGHSAFSMVFAGDVWLEEIADTYDAQGIEGILSESLQNEMLTADLCMINEEFPFGTGGTAAPDKQYTFRVKPTYVSVFKDMGVDVVSLANNHVLDYGTSVLSQTFQTLDQAEIDYVGAGETVDRAMQWKSYDIKGTKVAVLCASRVFPTADWNVEVHAPGVFSTYDPKKLNKQIAAAKEENDIVIVYVHWGIEKATTPEDYQTSLAHSYVDAGADLVIGSHPHVLQGIEYYNNAPIVYSLGNFMFHPDTESTALLKVNVDKWGNMSLKVIPAAASDAKTYEAADEQAQEILKSIEERSVNVTISEEGSVIVK